LNPSADFSAACLFFAGLQNEGHCFSSLLQDGLRAIPFPFRISRIERTHSFVQPLKTIRARFLPWASLPASSPPLRGLLLSALLFPLFRLRRSSIFTCSPSFFPFAQGRSLPPFEVKGVQALLSLRPKFFPLLRGEGRFCDRCFFPPLVKGTTLAFLFPPLAGRTPLPFLLPGEAPWRRALLRLLFFPSPFFFLKTDATPPDKQMPRPFPAVVNKGPAFLYAAGLFPFFTMPLSLRSSPFPSRTRGTPPPFFFFLFPLSRDRRSLSPAGRGCPGSLHRSGRRRKAGFFPVCMVCQPLTLSSFFPPGPAQGEGPPLFPLFPGDRHSHLR